MGVEISTNQTYNSGSMNESGKFYTSDNANNFAYGVTMDFQKSRIPGEFLKEVSGLFPNEDKLITNLFQQNILIQPTQFDDVVEQRHTIGTGQGFFLRHPNVEQEYQAARKDQNYGKPDDVVQRLMKGRPIHITPNHFPFYGSLDMMHALLWTTKEISKEQRDKYLAAWMIARNLTAQDLVIRLNPEFNRSIPLVKHYHLFYRLTDEGFEPDCS